MPVILRKTDMEYEHIKIAQNRLSLVETGHVVRFTEAVSCTVVGLCLCLAVVKEYNHPEWA